MPKISLSTWSFFLKTNYQRAMTFAVQNGFEGIEIWSNAFDFWPRTVTSKEIDTIKAVTADNRLTLAVHFCTIGNNLADLNSGHLQESINQLKETIRLCRRIGGRLVVVHPGTYPEIITHEQRFVNPKLTTAALKQEALGRFQKSLREAASFAESHDVVIGLENSGITEECVLSGIEDLAEWVDEINNPSLQITLDIGKAKQRDDVGKAMQLLEHRIKHIHLYDLNGDGAQHQEVGTGVIDWKAIAPFLKAFSGMLSLEVAVREDLEGAVLRSKAYLENLLAEE
jgi:sugar phosphate isomerase/epimerase